MAQALTTEELQEQQRRLTVYQDRYDQVLQPWGRKAPEPTLTESPGHYRRKVLSHAQLFLPENDQWRAVDVNDLASDALVVAERQILGALQAAQRTPALIANSAAGRPDTITPGIRMVEHHDANGLKMTTFHGDWFGRAFTRPARRVVSFLTHHGHVDSSGRALRRG
jgi:hypothetical protein